MNFKLYIWNEDSYDLFLQELKSYQDLKYQNFQSKLIIDNIPIIGVRSPILKKYAKEISKGDYSNFIKLNNHHYYEEIIIHGLLLGYLKTDFKDILRLLDEFLVFNTNWAINDGVCANLKIFKDNQEDGYKWIIKILKSSNPWDVRFGLVLLLNYYINDEYIDKTLSLATKTYIDEYYVNMAIAWLLSICYIKYPDKTKTIIKNQTLTKWIQNKTISKIRDSYQVSQEKKDYLIAFRK